MSNLINLKDVYKIYNENKEDEVRANLETLPAERVPVTAVLENQPCSTF